MIYGIGETWNYDENNYTSVPWNNYRSQIEEIEIEEGVTTIGNYLFSKLDNSNTITLPESVISIGNLAFYGNTKIKSISFSSKLNHIGWNPFVGCTSLKQIDIDSKNGQFIFENDCLFNQNKTIFYSYLSNNKRTSYELPQSVKTVATMAFHELTDLTELRMGKNTETILDRGIFNLPNMLNYNVHKDNVHFTSVDGVLFTDNGITMVKYPAAHPNITCIVQPEIQKVREGAFYSAKKLQSVIFHKNVRSVGDYCFYYCSSLKSVAYFGVSDPVDCKVAFTSDVPSFDVLVRHTYPRGIPFCGRSVFIANEPVGKDNKTNECYYVLEPVSGFLYFYGKGETMATPFSNPIFMKFSDVIKVVYVDFGIKRLGQYIFAKLWNVVNVYLPYDLEYMGFAPFEQMISLKTFTVPAGVTDTSMHPFANCTSLTDILVDKRSTHYKSINGSLYSYDGKKYVHYPPGRKDKEFIIPDFVEVIEPQCFFGSHYLERIHIGAKLKPYTSNPWVFCNGLKYITLSPDNKNFVVENNVVFNPDKTILYTYANNREASTYYIPYTVVEIGTSAMRGCMNMESLIIPQKVVTLNAYSLGTNYKLRRVFIMGTTNAVFTAGTTTSGITNCIWSIISTYKETKWGSVTPKKTLTYKPHSLGTGVHCAYDSTSQDLIIFGNGKMADGTAVDGDISGYKTLAKRIIVSDTVTHIGNHAFNGFTAATTVIISARTTTIGTYAFNGCKSVTTLVYDGKTAPTTCGSYAINGMSGSLIIYTPFSQGSLKICAKTTTNSNPLQ